MVIVLILKSRPIFDGFAFYLLLSVSLLYIRIYIAGEVIILFLTGIQQKCAACQL